MSVIRARQRGITGVTPHQGNRRFFVPNRARPGQGLQVPYIYGDSNTELPSSFRTNAWWQELDDYSLIVAEFAYKAEEVLTDSTPPAGQNMTEFVKGTQEPATTTLLNATGGADILAASDYTEAYDDVKAHIETMIELSLQRNLHFTQFTILPFGNRSPAPASYQIDARNDLNTWLLSLNGQTGVTVFDAASLVADGGNPDIIAAAYDNGDGVHINDAGATLLGEELNTVIN